MKVSIYILIFSFIALFSCDKSDLNVLPQDRLSPATFWTTEANALQAATGVYSKLSDAHSYQLFYADGWSDDAIPTGFWRGYYYYVWGTGNISPENGDLNSYWAALYGVIRTANVFLANVGACQMSESLRSRLIAEIKFIRAFEYTNLYLTWGEVPIADKPLEVSETKIGRAAAGETLKFILRDLTEAAGVLPVMPTETGRVTKGAALALKARVLLYAGNFPEAAATAKQIMDQGNYSLLRTPAGDGYFQLRNTKNWNNQEEIFGFIYDGTNSNNGIPGNLSLDGGLMSPSKSLVDSYMGYNKATDREVPVDESTTTSRFTNRDPRLDWSVAHTGTRDPVVSSPTYNRILDSETEPLSKNSTGYACFKFVNADIASNASKVTADNILFRYAEVLLTYAEAKIEANQIDQSVADAINDVRSRAYGAAKNEVAKYPEVTLGGQEAMKAIVRNERRVELAFEGLRWYDVKRWKIAAGPGGSMNGPVLGAKKADGTYYHAGTRALSEPNRDYLRPIPQKQIDLTGKDVLGQNPGY